MQYAILKAILDTSLSQYTCQSCGNKIDENHTDIVTMSDQRLDFRFTCHNCSLTVEMHAEIGNIQLASIMGHGSLPKVIKRNENALSEADITKIMDDLQAK